MLDSAGYPNSSVEVYMNAAAKNACRNVCVAMVVGLLVSVGVARLLADEDMGDDMCSGDMMWMIGWCLDGVGSDESVAPGAFALTSEEYVGSFESINVPGASATRAFGINARGDIVGSYTDRTGTHGFIRRGTAITSIDYPGSSSTEAWGINPRGDIIGRYTLANVPGAVRGFLLSHETYTDISVRKADQSYHLITLPTKIGACCAGRLVRRSLRVW